MKISTLRTMHIGAGSLRSLTLFSLLVLLGFGTTAAQCTHVVSLSGSAGICAGSDTLLLSGAAGASQIVWTSAAGSVTVDSVNGSIDTTYIPAAGGSYVAYVTLAGGCADTSAAVLVDSVRTPSVSVHVSTSTTICAGTRVTFTPTAVNGGTPAYQWYINGNPVSTAAIYVDSTLSNGDSVWVVMTTSLTCTTSSTAASSIIHFTVDPLLTPSVTISANSSDTICQNTQVILYAVASDAGINPNFQWKRNGVNVGNSATYLANPISSGDIYSCVVTSTAACYTQRKATSDSITFVVNAYPAVTVATAYSCTGDSVTLTAAGGAQYVWSTGATSASILTGAGSYTVTATNAYGCTAGSTPLTVTPRAPLTDSLTVSGDTLALASAPGQFYQWYRDDSIIAGAITDSYVASHSGYYQLAVIDSFGCKTTSAVISLIYSGISTLSADVVVNIYPNPNTGRFTLELSDNTPRQVSITDVQGRVVADNVTVIGKQVFNLSTLTEGIYYMQIREGSGSKTLKFSVMR